MMPDVTTDIWECEHKAHELRTRRIVGGGIQYRQQCLRCGQSVGNAVSHAQVQVLPPEWDELLHPKWQESRRALSEQRRLKDSQSRRDEYQRYLATPQWRARRDKVLQREGFVCQGCLSARATEVHHKNYEHIGAELLFDLVAVCAECHRRAHGMDPFDDA